MRKLALLSFMAAATLCAADLDNNTVTVTATRTLNAQPDQMLLYISLLATPDKGLDDVVAIFKGTGIGASNLLGVSGARMGQFILDPGSPIVTPSVQYSQWTFQLPVPFAKTKEVLSTLTALQSTLGQVQNSPALSISSIGVQSSAAESCPLPALVSDARKQADALASATGLRAGAILSISNSAIDTVVAQIGVPASLSRIGDFLLGVPYGLVGVPSSQLSTPQPACSLTVQFKLQ